jgi:alpha-1,2-mannosyltransferase
MTDAPYAHPATPPGPAMGAPGPVPPPPHRELTGRAILDALRSGGWLDRERVVAYCTLFLVLEIITFLFMVIGTHGLIVPLEKPTTTDFVSFYAAGLLSNAGAPELAYDQAVHFAVEQNVTAPGIGYQFFFYPPPYLLLCAALAKLPYYVSFVLFEGASLLLYLAVARRILGIVGREALVPILAFPALFWTIGLGQNSFLTAALFGGATLLVESRPLIAGLLFGALCYKPHFGLLVPVALAAGGHWRSFLGAAAAVGTLVLLSLGLFGWETWQAYFAAAADSAATYENGRIDLSGLISPFAGVRLAGGSAAFAYSVQAVATLSAALFVAHIWRRRASLPVRAAALTAGTMVCVPVILIYDLMIGAVAMLWLVRAGRDSGFLPWEKAVFATLFASALLSRNVGLATHLPLALLVNVALLAVITMRMLQERPITRAGDGITSPFIAA